MSSALPSAGGKLEAKSEREREREKRASLSSGRDFCPLTAARTATHRRSVLRGIFLGMLLRPSPWQSTVVPLQVQRAGQAPASAASRVHSISTHIQSGLAVHAPERPPLLGMSLATEARRTPTKEQNKTSLVLLGVSAKIQIAATACRLSVIFFLKKKIYVL